MTETSTAMAISGVLTVLTGLVGTVYLAYVGDVWSWLGTTGALIGVGVAFLFGAHLFRIPDRRSQLG